MENKITYKGYQIEETACLTNVRRECCGRSYTKEAPLYDIWLDGSNVKPYGQRPWITSMAEAKRWVNEARRTLK